MVSVDVKPHVSFLTRSGLEVQGIGTVKTIMPLDFVREDLNVVRGCESCHNPFIRSGQNHLARHSERGKKTRRTKKEAGRQHQEMDKPGVRQVPEGSGELRTMEKTGCKIFCGAPTTLADKGLLMLFMLMKKIHDETIAHYWKMQVS